ncbi:hypothetical protein ES702_03496 [subsurface metagenome]
MGNWDYSGVKTLTWRERLLEMVGEDIAQYLERRYGDYCKDKNERSSVSGDKAQMERHKAKQEQLIKFGIKLREKLSFFPAEPRGESFEQIYKDNETLDIYFKKVYDDFCKELEETDKAFPIYKQRGPHKLHIEMTDKEKQLFKYKEIMKNDCFIENIDKRRADYEKIKVEYEKKKIEDEKRRAKEKERKERIAKKKGHSNIKPIDFYERLYCRYGSPFGYERFCNHSENYVIMQQEREWDVYFEERGKPSEDDYRCSKKKPLRYKLDSLEDNKIYLDRCKQLLKVFKPFCDDYDSFDDFQAQINIYREYLDKGYLITRQIAHISKSIGRIFWRRIDNETRNQLSVSDKNKYKIDVFNDDSFDIKEIKIKVNKFIGGGEEGELEILTIIESLKEYLKDHNNRITAKEYSTLTNQSYKMALVVLKKFVVNKELKSKKEERGLNIFYN